MSGKTVIALLFLALLLTACSPFAGNTTTYTNGLRCENYTDLRGNQGANCSYLCQDGSEYQINIPDTVSPLYAASRAELNAQFCGIALQPTPTELPATPSPSALPTEPPTLPVTPTIANSPTAQTSVTAEILVTGSSLLTGRVTMCDTGGGLISFRLVQPPPDLTGKTPAVQIGEQESACYINQVNPSLMTCTIPGGVVFPARVTVNLDGAVVNDFVYDGLGCAKITTPVATAIPSVTATP